MGTRILSAVLLASIATAIHAAPPDLHQAVTAGDKSAVVRLLNKGAKVDARDERRNTPLHLAVSALVLAKAQAGDLDLVECLIAGGADESAVNAAQETPIGQAWLTAEKGGRADVRDLLMRCREGNLSVSALQNKHGIALPAPPPVPENHVALYLAAEELREREIERLRAEAKRVQADKSLSPGAKAQRLTSLNAHFQEARSPEYFPMPRLDASALRVNQVGAFADAVKIVHIFPDELLVDVKGVPIIVRNTSTAVVTTGQVIPRWQTAVRVVGTRDLARDGQPQRVVWVVDRFDPRRFQHRRAEVVSARTHSATP